MGNQGKLDEGFVGRSLEMTYTQWIFWWIFKHYRTKGTQVLAAKEDLLKEIKHQLEMDMELSWKKIDEC